MVIMGIEMAAVFHFCCSDGTLHDAMPAQAINTDVA
jgi:hypothetical protein